MSDLLNKPTSLSEKMIEELIDLGMNVAVGALETFLVAQEVPFETTEWFAEQIADKIKNEHASNRATY